MPVGGRKYEIHPVMLAFLRCKSQEDNFVTCLGFCSDISSSCTRLIRRLSLQHGHKVDFSTMDLSHTRSLVVFDDASAVPFKNFERLRVLDLEDTGDLENAHLVDICGLLWLRYLGLKGTPISELPPQIGILQHLETLDVRNTMVSELPWEAGQISKSVRVLAGDEDSRQCVKLPEGVCQDLKNRIPASSLAKCREVLSIVLFDRFGMDTVPPHVGVFKVPNRHMRIPQLIKVYFDVLSSLDIRLCKLDTEGDDLKFLREMPNLQTLVVRFELLPREPIAISGEGFAMLESFCVDSRIPRVTFGQGAMPNLKRLAFKFYAGPAGEDDVGITHLRSLEKVVFRCSPWYKSDSPGISKTVAVVRREAGEHPNRITLCINGHEEVIFPEKDSAQICQENRGAGNFASCSRTSEIEEI